MRKLVTIGTVLVGLSLLGLGVHCLLPAIASAGYGIPIGDANPGYLFATGARDAVLGLMALGILFWHRRALPLFLSCLVLLPIADVAIVMAQGTGLKGIGPHAFGVVGLLVLSAMAWWVRNDGGERP